VRALEAERERSAVLLRENSALRQEVRMLQSALPPDSDDDGLSEGASLAAPVLGEYGRDIDESVYEGDFSAGVPVSSGAR